MKVIERIANLAIIVAVAVFLVLVAKGKFFRSAPAVPPRSAMAQVGSTVSLPGVHFPAQRDSLLLGISATCHFCRDSLPFYKQLTAQLQGKVSVIAVLPQKQADAEAFIRQAGITGAEVVSANLGSIGVYATPTLLLVDSKGKVKSAWVGEQDQAGQQKILSAVLPAVASAVPTS